MRDCVQTVARFIGALALILSSFIAAVPPAAAQKTPEKIRLTPQSKEGVILLRVDTIPADNQLWFNKTGNSGFGSRIFVINVPVGVGDPVYVARTLLPGRYRLDSLWQQKRWGILLRKDTVEFEVKAGKITYLGKLNNADLLTAMQRDAIAAGKTVSRGLDGFISDKHGLAVALSDRDDVGLANAARFAQDVMRADKAMVALGDLFESKGDK